MSQRVCRLGLLGALLGSPFFFVACFMGHGPDPALEVAASVASVTLADDCEGSGLRAPADCAPEDPDCGGSYCRQTGVRLTIDAAAEGASVPFEVLAMRLYAEDGSLVQTLPVGRAQIFDGSSYADWDQTVHPGDSLHVSFDVGAPDWATIGGGDSWSTYGMSFRVELDVQIDGVARTLEFSPASREPEVVT